MASSLELELVQTGQILTKKDNPIPNLDYKSSTDLNVPTGTPYLPKRKVGSHDI